MAILPEDFAPYAPTGNILNLIHRLRERGLPNTLTTAELERLGVPEGNLGRVSQTLRFLELIDDEAKRTEKFELLGKASTEQYTEVLKNVVEEAYSSVLMYVNPAVDGEMKVTDQFRHYKPESVRSRMVALFYGLCQEAGIVPEGTVPRSTPTRAFSVKATSNGERQKQTTQTPNNKQHTSTHPNPNDSKQETNQSAPLNGTEQTSKYQLLDVLLRQLPLEGKWPQKRRDQWLQAVQANVDLLIEIEEIQEQNEPQQRLPL